MDKESPIIRRQAQREKVRIYWSDAIMGPQSGHAVERSYGLKGQTPLIMPFHDLSMEERPPIIYTK